MKTYLTQERFYTVYTFNDVQKVYDNEKLENKIEGFEFYEMVSNKTKVFVHKDYPEGLWLNKGNYVVFDEVKNILTVLTKQQFKMFFDE